MSSLTAGALLLGQTQRHLAALVVLTSAVSLSEPSAAASGDQVLTVTESELDGERFSLVLEVNFGVRDESPTSWGSAAATLAALVAGPTDGFAAFDLDTLAGRAGIVTTGALGWTKLRITMTGPSESFEFAFWLAAARLRSSALPPSDVRQGLARGALSSSPKDAPPAVSAEGDGFDHALSLLFGPRLAASSRASIERASQESAAHSRLVEAVLTTRRVSATVVGPRRLLERVPALTTRYLRQARRGRVEPVPLQPPQPALPPTDVTGRRLALRHTVDARHLVTLAWDTTGVARILDLKPHDMMARLLAVETLMTAAGGPVARDLIDNHGLARQIWSHRRSGEHSAVGLTAEVRGRQLAEARSRLVASIEQLGSRRLERRLMRGISRIAVMRLDARWSAPETRAALVQELRRLSSEAPAAVFSQLRAALVSLEPADMRDFASYAFASDRLAIVEMMPTSMPAENDVVVDADTSNRFLRILVDLRCPKPGNPRRAEDLLATKYQLSGEQYVALSRAIARQPRRLRDLNSEAEMRCLEHTRLLEVVNDTRALALHKALACGPAQVDDSDRREALQSSIFDRFDLDPSIYRPRMALAAEDMSMRVKLAAIDARCKPLHGPASRRP